MAAHIKQVPTFPDCDILFIFSSDFDIICIAMHGLSRSYISDTYFTNIVFPFSGAITIDRFSPSLYIVDNSITKTCLFKYTETFTTKKWKFSDKNKYSGIFFLYFCSKHRLWRGGSKEYPQSMFWAEIKTNNVYPCKPQFLLYKSRV